MFLLIVIILCSVVTALDNGPCITHPIGFHDQVITETVHDRALITTDFDKLMCKMRRYNTKQLTEQEKMNECHAMGGRWVIKCANFRDDTMCISQN
jgi:hypothetical protein